MAALDPGRSVAVADLATEGTLAAAGARVKARLADALEAGAIRMGTATVDDLARLAYVCAGDAIVYALAAAEGCSDDRADASWPRRAPRP